MEQEKLYVIEEKTYEAHIDEEVHLYGLLHQLAFLAGKIKDREDVEAFIAAAKRYGQIADDKFDAWNTTDRRVWYPCTAASRAGTQETSFPPEHRERSISRMAM